MGAKVLSWHLMNRHHSRSERLQQHPGLCPLVGSSQLMIMRLGTDYLTLYRRRERYIW